MCRQPAMRGTVVWRRIGATKDGNGKRKYDLLSSAHATVGGALFGILERQQTHIITSFESPQRDG